VTYRRILVPVDGSTTSNAGVREAVKLAKAQRARLRLVHVVDEFSAFSTPEGGINAGTLINLMKQSGKQILRRTERLAAGLGAKPETVLCESVGARVADVITQQAKRWRADLIVMGTHGRRGVNRLLLGSDAELVARSSPAPLLLVRSKGRARKAKRSKRK